MATSRRVPEFVRSKDAILLHCLCWHQILESCHRRVRGVSHAVRMAVREYHQIAFREQERLVYPFHAEPAFSFRDNMEASNLPTFQGPLDTFNKADDYLEALKKLASIIQRIDLKKVFVDGDDVCVLYDMVTNTPAGTAFIAEWYQVKGGKITALRAVFDARPFAALFGR